MANPFTPGDLVVSVYGRGQAGDTTAYTDNQASPLTLQDISTSGVVGGQLVLPQTVTTVNGVTQYAVSGEYGSSSEGSLSLSTDGQSLVVAGYNINAAAYNTAEASGGPNTYGDPRLAQSTSVPGGQYTPVQRVIADVRYDGTVDSSTALYNVYNGNNPRSVVTDNGSVFYISGQGQSGDTTQGVFRVADGAATATTIDNTTDTRSLLISNGTLYASRDSKQPKANPADNVGSYGLEPTATATATPLPGISKSVTLANGNGNNVNGSTGTANLSPENFFFANATTLYVADAGAPKQGGAGDGGLQKWSLVNGTWTLNYTLSNGLGLKQATGAATTTAGFSTGLIGLTGKTNTDGTVSLYATSEPNFDTDSTALYGITDTLAYTSAAQASGESFQTLMTAAPDTVIRGVAFAPQAAAVCFAGGTRIRTTRGDVAVEALAVGDVAVTAAGAEQPIRWLGHRTVDCHRHPRRDEVLPVRIAAHAFGAGQPVFDLVLSPGHSVCVDMLGEVLIPAAALVNGTTIVREQVDAVTYWHVELDKHEVILAENLPCESYFEMGNRGFFVGEAGATALHGAPDAAVADHSDFCRPFHAAGPVVDFVRERLAARALQLDWVQVENTFADLHLVVDSRRVEAEVHGLIARFLVPATAETVWLESDTVVPAMAGGGADLRALGVCVGKLVIDDGFSSQVVMADDARLSAGFHHVEEGPQRWTAGRARLPASLWEGCRGSFFLRVELTRPALPKWIVAGIAVREDVVALSS